ncbi:MAG TPA: hypothetical protein VM285_12845, partial [Polyangia bacterium]|nr:hypothetical protein [Polyangia bacterium]
MGRRKTTASGSSARALVRILPRLAVALVILRAAACTTTHTVRTVGRGNFGIETTLGGPMFTNLGAPVFAPNLFIGGRYGVLDDLDLFAAYNLTGPIIPGIALDLALGVHWVPIQPGLRAQIGTPRRGWSLATGVELHSLSDFETGFMVFPAVDLAVGYRDRWFNPFVGASLGLNCYRPFDEVEPVMLSPYLGVELIISRKAAVSARVTFFDVTHNYWGSQVEWVYLARDDGARERYAILGVSLGFSFDFVSDPVEQQPAEVEPAG